MNTSQVRRLSLSCSNSGRHPTRRLITLVLDGGGAEILPFYIAMPKQSGPRFRRARDLLLEQDLVEVNCPHCPPREPFAGQALRAVMGKLDVGSAYVLDVSTGATVIEQHG